mgnify:CR=1 FL=1
MSILVGCLDFESTGLDVENDRIVEAALVVMDLESGAERLAFEKRINPGVHIPAKAVEVHGITDADVVQAPAFASIAQGFAKLLGSVHLIVGHNIARFDAPLLAHELVRAGVSVPAFPPVFDTMLEGRFATDDGKVPTLGELCFALDTPYDPEQAHAALYDVRVNLQAFRRGWQIGAFKVPVIDEILKQRKEAA